MRPRLACNCPPRRLFLCSQVSSNAAAAASASAATHARSAALAAATAERARQKASTPEHLIDLLDRTAPSPPAKAPLPVWPPRAPTVIRPPSAPAMLGSSASMQSLQSTSTEEGSHARHQPSRASLRRSASSGMLCGAPGTALCPLRGRACLLPRFKRGRMPWPRFWCRTRANYVGNQASSHRGPLEDQGSRASHPMTMICGTRRCRRRQASSLQRRAGA